MIPFPDGLFLAQRYAIDFVRVDVDAALAGGNPFAHGDPTQNENYLTFGNDVLAVTDGRIVDTRDGMPENVPNVLPAADVTTAAGNYVVEALDDHRFALYAHLQPGSLRVRPGDRVRRGDVLALVGNTGNSSMPHLHFHVIIGRRHSTPTACPTCSTSFSSRRRSTSTQPTRSPSSCPRRARGGRCCP